MGALDRVIILSMCHAYLSFSNMNTVPYFPF